MPSRKAHQKTRFGCGPCKKRRIKCDETHPICKNCSRKGLECSFLLLAPSSRLSPLNSTSPATTQSPQTPSGQASASTGHQALLAKKPLDREQFHVFQASSGIPRAIPQLRSVRFLGDLTLQDLSDICPQLLDHRFRDLLSHYENQTSATLDNNGSAQKVWRMAIPELAAPVENRYLLHGLFAIACLHMSRSAQGPDQTALEAFAASQMNASLSRYRDALSRIHKDNCEALFAFSALVSVFVYGTAPVECKTLLSSIQDRESMRNPNISKEMCRIAVKTLRALRGALVVLNPTWHWVSTGKLAAICTREWWPRNPTLASAQAIEEDRKLCALESLWMQPGRNYEYYFSTLAIALKQLRECFALVSSIMAMERIKDCSFPCDYVADDTTMGTLMDRGAIFTWPIHLSPEFVALCERQNPEALVILAHFAILPGRVRGVWWVDGIGPTLLAAAALVLGEERWHLIEWPARVVGVKFEALSSGSASFMQCAADADPNHIASCRDNMLT